MGFLQDTCLSRVYLFRNEPLWVKNVATVYGRQEMCSIWEDLFGNEQFLPIWFDFPSPCPWSYGLVSPGLAHLLEWPELSAFVNALDIWCCYNLNSVLLWAFPLKISNFVRRRLAFSLFIITLWAPLIITRVLFRMAWQLSSKDQKIWSSLSQGSIYGFVSPQVHRSSGNLSAHVFCWCPNFSRETCTGLL